MKARTAVLLAAMLALSAGCGERKDAAVPPPPREVSEASVGHYCGMQLTEHAGPKGQIFVTGRNDPVWFSSVRDTIAFTLLPEEPKNLAVIYVNDMAKATNWDQPEPGTWIDARRAVFVIDSRRRGGMGAEEAVPFGESAAAERFVAANGGRIVDFAGIPKDYILSEGETPPRPPPPSEATLPGEIPAGRKP